MTQEYDVARGSGPGWQPGAAPVAAPETPTTPAQASLGWYKKHAWWAKAWYRASEVTLVVLGAMVPVSTVITSDPIAPALLGAGVVVVTGLRQVFTWHEDWVRFSAAVVALSAEQVRFANRVPPYDQPDALAQLAMKVSELESAETRSWTSMQSKRVVHEQP